MKLLITGASGFIGSHLVSGARNAYGTENIIAFSSLQVHGCQTIIYRGSSFNLSQADRALLATVDVLIHLGAFTPKSGEHANAIEKCNSNITFTERLLALPFKCLKKIIYVSSLDVYEPAELITEATPTRPVSLYGWSKLYCEHMTAIFAANQKVACQILRVGHVYGPGEERYGKLLPKAINSILRGGAVELWGDGSELRSLIYIDDVVAAILRSVSLQNNVGPINVVSGVAVSVRELLEKIIWISGKPTEVNIVEFKGIKRDYIFDNAKLQKYLLSDETDLIDGLRAEYDHMARLV